MWFVSSQTTFYLMLIGLWAQTEVEAFHRILCASGMTEEEIKNVMSSVRASDEKEIEIARHLFN